MSNNTQQKFEQWLKQIINELVWATCYFKVWEQLWPSTEEIARIENLYLNFFQLTRTAHNHQFMLQLSRILDRRKDSINIFRLINMIEKQPNLITKGQVDIQALRAKLSKQQEGLKRLTKFRNKKLAHVDEQFHTNTNLSKSIHVYVGEARALLTDLAQILTEISVAYNGAIPTFETIGIGDTSELLKTLMPLEKIKQQLLEIAEQLGRVAKRDSVPLIKHSPSLC